jgi:hypothetical protein
MRSSDRRLHELPSQSALALLAGTFVANGVGTLLDLPALWVASWYLAVAGVVAGGVAIISGAAAVARRGAGGWRVAGGLLAHALAVTLFAITWVLRGTAEIPPDPGILLLEGVGVALLLLGVALGGRRATAPFRGVARHWHTPWGRRSTNVHRDGERR